MPFSESRIYRISRIFNLVCQVRFFVGASSSSRPLDFFTGKSDISRTPLFPKKENRQGPNMDTCLCVRMCVRWSHYCVTTILIHSLLADPAELVAVNRIERVSTDVTVPLNTPLLKDNPAGIAPPFLVNVGLPVT